ncbi:protein kinase domain-containing protein [Sorangium sp. So ce1000]|uniref:protein kinase domain-containing protein n=1 Tax=Sorangium sp. So ce1000 TaxID=3133325 RepID=UPI003F622C85
MAFLPNPGYDLDMPSRSGEAIEVSGVALDVLVHQGIETALYRGRRRGDGAPVAVKVTQSDYPTFRQLARLRREHAILRDLSMPGVPRALDLLPHGRGLALVLEDLGPTSLADLIARRGRLDAKTTLCIAAPLVRTLDALHRQHIIHKDIKPRNVMIDEATLSPRLVDFGIAARLAQETQEASAMEGLEGTPAYIAPEQTGRMNRPVDRRSDLYALGVTLYHMLTGATPFQAADATEAIHAHLTRVPAPPHAVVKDVPRGLSDVVMRLLAKAPEDRYQSARGLLADLEECQRRLDASGTVEPLPLGRDDLVEDVVLPDRLVGREAELGALKAALDRARSGAATLALVAGPPGIGKSALVRELCATQAREAYFAPGKFDAMARSMPLSAFSQVIRALVRQTLAEPPDTLLARKHAIEAALGEYGRVVTDLCPELELVIGPQPQLPATSASEAKNRLALLIRRFLSVFSREDAPLVMFFDDLQWADLASLDLLGRLLMDMDAHHLCVVGAYRDEEVDAAHPLTATIGTLREAGIEPFEVTLGPLTPAAVTAIVAEALHADLGRAEPLAALIRDKTHSNPLFIGQFLRELESDGLLRFDPEARGFVWDLERVEGAMVTDNVLALMARKIERLAPATRRALMCASCIGASFDLRALATIVEKSPAAVAADLREALREGLVQPLGGNYRLLEEAGDALEPMDVAVPYRFLHDRVKEACYALVPEAERPAVHLAIGRLLMARGGGARGTAGLPGPSGGASDVSGRVPDEDLLEVVRHLNLGAREITDETERMDIARLDLRAGRRAMAATAFEAAASLFAAGRALASEKGFSRDHEVCFALWLEGAEAEYLIGAFEEQEALTATALARAESARARASVHSVRARALTTRGRFADAVRAGLSGLAELGVTITEDPAAQQAAFMQGVGDVDRLLAGRSIEALAHAPVTEDPEDRQIFTLMAEIWLPVYFVSKTLFGLVIVEQVRRSLARGQSETSALPYAGYSLILCLMMGRHAEGHAFGRVAVSLCERWKSPTIAARVHVTWGTALYVCEPLRNAVDHAIRSRDAALEAGDNLYLGINLGYCLLQWLIGAGVPLEEVKAEADRAAVLARRTKDPVAIAAITVSRQLVACLTGQTRGRTSLDSDGVVLSEALAALNEKEHAIVFYYKHVYRLVLHVLYGEHETALEAAADAARFAEDVKGIYWPANAAFLEALARAGLAREAEDPEARKEHEAAITPLKARLDALARSCPSNFQHKVALLDAELCALRGERWEAIEQYDQAIELAREHGYAQDEAIANERCGRFLLSLGRERAAQGYLADAFRGHLHWGATAKAEALLFEFPSLSARISKRDTNSQSSTSESATSHTTLLGRATMGSLRDAALVLRAVQMIAGEVVLSRVVSRLMQIVLENSGAERGILLLSRDDRLFVEAAFRASPESIEVGQRRPLEDEPELAQQAVLYAWRTREELVLDDAAGDSRFASDPYLAEHKTRSILCMPVSSQGRTAGILYLENSATAGVFTAVRVELLGLLASQASIAIENALLLEGIQEANEEARLANARLEREVEQRTRELERSNAELARELEDRTRAEAERAALREQVMEAQKARLLELMAPLMPISEDVLVMPIIGTVEAERAAQIMEVALAGAQQTGARALILDITGMRYVDAAVVSALVSVANALRLLGTEPLFTGIRPDVARTMVELGVDLQAMTTLSTLRAGIARALSGSAMPRGGEGRRPAR